MSNIIEDDLESLLSEDNSQKSSDKQIKDDNAVYYTVELPSNGLLGYPSEVEYRDIMVKDEKRLSTATDKTFGRILNDVLKSLLKDDSFFDHMTIYDRDYLLLWIWANNYSTVKTVEAECPSCGAISKYNIDLTKLEITNLSDKYKNPYPYTLKNGEEVTFRLLTVNDEEVARKFCVSNKDYDETFVMLCLSVGLKTIMPLKEKIKWIEENMSGKDMSILRGFHKYFKYGINDTVEQTCKNCGEVNKISIPFQIDFFIPTLSNDFG